MTQDLKTGHILRASPRAQFRFIMVRIVELDRHSSWVSPQFISFVYVLLNFMSLCFFCCVFSSCRVLCCCGVVLVVSCFVLFLLCVCVCDLFLFLQVGLANYLSVQFCIQVGDLMQDLKTGHILRASPRAHFSFFYCPNRRVQPTSFLG